MGWKQDLGAKFRESRLNARISLREMGDLVGVKQETIRQWELGRVPDTHKLAKLALLLKIQEFVVDGFTIAIAETSAGRSESTAPEQFKLDFEADYINANTNIRIRPGSVDIRISGVRMEATKKSRSLRFSSA